MLNLRPYQAEALDAIEEAWARGMRAPAVVLPTGAGKTVVFAHGVQRWLAEHPGARALVLAHRTELINQAAAKLHAVAPDLPIGVVKANRNDTLARAIVGSVQTLAGERRRLMLRRVGLIVVDEAHHATAPSYRAVMDHWPGASLVGFTATMTRGDEAALGSVWQDVVYQRSIAEMIGDGYLVRPRGRRVWVEDLDLSKVRRSRGDYSEGSLGEAIEGSMAPEAVAKAWAEFAADRQGILFAPTVATAELFAAALNEAGFPAVVVWGDQPADQRAAVLERSRTGEIQVVCNCMVLTEGTDMPWISCIVVARATTHSGLYIQMAGRGLRLWPGKGDCLILDVVGASQRHALTAHIELFGEDPEKPQKAEEPDGELEPDEELGGEFWAGDGDAGWLSGPLASVEVDLFHGSESAWLRTAGGTWFLPAGERYIAIVPWGRSGAWAVTAMHRYRRGTGRWVATDVADLAYAMAWAEQDVSVAEMMTARRERGWRAQRPSQKQLDLAARYRIAVEPRMLSGEVSNRIAVAMASGRIDPIVHAYLGAMR